MSQPAVGSQGDDREVEAFVERVGDPDRLMEGEVPETIFLEDCEHWVTTYTELRDFKVKVLEAAKEASSMLGPSGQPEADNDIKLLSAELDRLVKRVEFWEQRRADLSRAKR